jgi:membrane-associated protease RseP (regulator of RpoE activity)
MILAALSLFVLYLVVSTLTPLPPDPNSPQFGLGIMSVTEGSPAAAAGLTRDSILQFIAGEQIRNAEGLRAVLTANLGQTVDMTWQTSTGEVITRPVQLPPQPGAGGAILGVQTLALSPDPTTVLEQYKMQFATNPFALLRPPTMMQGDVPYSDYMARFYESSVFGDQFPIIANTLFWLWFVNFNVGIFNALPIGPLDGGQLYGSLIEKKVKSAVIARNANYILTLVMTMIVLAGLALPYIF